MLRVNLVTYAALRVSELLQGLKKRGFQLTMGVGGSGIFYLALLKAGGYYLGTPTCVPGICARLTMPK